jgi:glutamyl-tRNA synthetase
MDASILLRIDDVDQEKVHPQFVDDIFRSLDWLGIEWNEGPQTADEYAATWSQRFRYDSYFAAIDALVDKGLVFACSCTRAELRAASETMTYAGTCEHKGLELQTPETSLRWRAPHAAIPYPIVRQKNGAPAYMIASIVDDVQFGITHIYRGEDLRPASETQRSLAESVDMLAPFLKIEIDHHPLITDAGGQKLSKSQGSTDLRSMRERGEGPERIIERVGRYLGVDGARCLDDLLIIP